MIREKAVRTAPGIPALLVLLITLLAAIAGIVYGAFQESPWLVIGSILILITDVILLVGLFMVNPNESKVLQLFFCLGIPKGI